MTVKFVPREKMGKRARRQADAAKRRTWDCSPVSRVMSSPKAYDRNKIAARCRERETGDGFFIFGANCEKGAGFRTELYRSRP